MLGTSVKRTRTGGSSRSPHRSKTLTADSGSMSYLSLSSSALRSAFRARSLRVGNIPSFLLATDRSQCGQDLVQVLGFELLQVAEGELEPVVLGIELLGALAGEPGDAHLVQGREGRQLLARDGAIAGLNLRNRRTMQAHLRGNLPLRKPRHLPRLLETAGDDPLALGLVAHWISPSVRIVRGTCRRTHRPSTSCVCRRRRRC